MATANPVFEVLLEKRSRGRMITMSRSWALRTIRLTKQQLSYYDVNDMKGSVSIAGATMRLLQPSEADGKSFPFEIDTGSEKLMFNASCAETRNKCIEIFGLAAKAANWDEVQQSQIQKLKEERESLYNLNAVDAESSQSFRKDRPSATTLTSSEKKAPKAKVTALKSGMTLLQDQYLQSKNGCYYAIMQTDGNFVVYLSRHAVPANILWSSNLSNETTGPFCLKLKDDGKLSIQDGSGSVLWQSENSPVDGSHEYGLYIEDDGNLVLKDAHNVVHWTTDTSRGSSDSSLLLPL